MIDYLPQPRPGRATGASGPLEAFAYRVEEEATRFGSARLAAALKVYEETTGAARREALRNASVSRSVRPLAVARPCPVAAAPASPADKRPPAFGREPCPYCATRGDLGCAHFAPCEPVCT